MHDILVVHVVQSQTYLLDYVWSLAFLENTHSFDLVKKITTTNKLHNNVVASLIFKKLKYASNMWVHRVLKNLQLVLVQFLVDICDLQTALADNFDGTGHLRELMVGKFDWTKSTAAKFLFHDIVVRQFFYGLERLILLEG